MLRSTQYLVLKKKRKKKIALRYPRNGLAGTVLALHTRRPGFDPQDP